MNISVILTSAHLSKPSLQESSQRPKPQTYLIKLPFRKHSVNFDQIPLEEKDINLILIFQHRKPSNKASLGVSYDIKKAY